jgi:2-hydroxychromene-2-carboxylate isomerase
MKRRPRLYFSFRSPYSWMAIEQLRKSIPELFERLDLYPYWDPDARTEQSLRERGAELSYQQMSKAKHLYVLGDTKRMATRLGLKIAWPVDIDPWWEVPHLGWLAARQTGDGERCYDALVAARWGRGENICDPEVFRRVVAGAGLDAAVLGAAAEAADIRAEGVRCLVAAYEDDVFGVPYLLLGRQRFWGIDRVQPFLEEFEAAGGRAALSELPGCPAGLPAGLPAGIAVGAYDRDTAGGCG